MRRSPQCADLLFLAPGHKGLLLHPQRNEVSEAFGFGITAARLPAEHRSPGDPEEAGQFHLREIHRCAQRDDGLSEGVVTLSVGMSPHRRALLA